MNRRPNILLIVVDSLRADHCSCYGYGANTTPVIDQIAREGILFKSAISAAGWTLPSHASMFTGLYPTEHGADAAGCTLDKQIPTLASILNNAGYATAAFSDNPIALAHGLDRGFSTVVDSWHESHGNLRETAKKFFGPRLVGKAKELRRVLYSKRVAGAKVHGSPRTINSIVTWVRSFMGDRGSFPFFLFANFTDVHMPYFPPMRLARPILASAAVGQGVYSLKQINISSLVDVLGLEESDLQLLRDLYDGEISYVDGQLGGFFSQLDQLGALNNSLVIITADHGDHLGDHGMVGHGISLYDSLLKVPLVVSYPGHVQAGKVHEKQVQTLDIFSTVLDAAGVSRNDQPFDNHMSLLRQADSSAVSGPRELAFAESCGDSRYMRVIRRRYPGIDESRINVQRRCARTDRYKYMLSDGLREEFYDLATDPGEANNLAALGIPAMGELRSALARWHSSLTPTSLPDADTCTENVPEEVTSRLKALGYIS